MENNENENRLNLQAPVMQNVEAFSLNEELDEHAAKLKDIELGPLKDLMLYDDAISDIMVNGPDKIFVEKNGRIELSSAKFESTRQLEQVIDNILSPVGRHIGPESPLVDARLPDGSRVNVVIPPISLIGPMISIRKYPKNKLTVSDLLRFNSISPEMAEFLKICVMARKNIVVAGGTGSGKTTLLNILSSFIPDSARIITIEDAAELQLHKEHVGKLEAQPPDIDGKGEVTIRQLVINALRMRPDRIVVGECRGGEALDMLQAMNTGHDGSLTTIHGNSCRDILNRIETMVLMAGVELPLSAIREQVASAIDIIVHISRFPGGTRNVVSITEINGMEGNVITMTEIFNFVQTGVTSDWKVRGKYSATGVIPTFLNDVRQMGIEVNMGMFEKK